MFSIRAAIDGAKEVISVESNQTFFNQALFVKEYFDKVSNRILPITYVKNNISFLDFPSLGKFDVILALSILYHVGKHEFGKYKPKALEEQKIVIGKLCNMSNCIIVRGRKGKLSNQQYYDPIFSKLGFKNKKTIDEGKRILIKYAK